jgi:hypothetical protein
MIPSEKTARSGSSRSLAGESCCCVGEVHELNSEAELRSIEIEIAIHLQCCEGNLAPV